MVELTYLIAKLASISFIAIGLAALFNKDFYLKLMKDTFKNKAVILLYGFFALFVGFLILNYHNIWKGWPIIITLFGWIGFIKGLFLIILPKTLEDFSMIMFKGWIGKIIPFTAIILGLILGYIGFFL